MPVITGKSHIGWEFNVKSVTGKWLSSAGSIGPFSSTKVSKDSSF